MYYFMQNKKVTMFTTLHVKLPEGIKQVFLDTYSMKMSFSQLSYPPIFNYSSTEYSISIWSICHTLLFLTIAIWMFTFINNISYCTLKNYIIPGSRLQLKKDETDLWYDVTFAVS